jgi:glyoxylase-like metal-dependent hydrolase (beta-lactamase superfamily II)
VPNTLIRARSASRSVNAQRAPQSSFGVDFSAVRALASVLPGAKPIGVNAIRVAASIRPKKFVIEGGDETPFIMPRTAFQIVYGEGTVMIDSGLDRETHDSFGRPDDPYFSEEFGRLQRALNRASLIVLTHFHADHVAGVLRAPNFDELARKTVVSATTADFLVNRPHRPHLKLSREAADRFIIIEYRHVYPVAPGVVLIQSPGHSPDSQMVYFQLRSGDEFLHSVDTAWSMQNVLQVRGKAAPWVNEDADAVTAQLRWLKGLCDSEPDLTILISHDGELFDTLTKSGRVGELES